MAQNMFGSALNPQNVVPLDINTSTSYAANFLPPYQNVSSGTYLLQNINPLSDTFLQTTDRGNLNTLYYSFSTASQVLVGTPSSFVLQGKNDFNYFPLATRYSPWTTSATVFAVAWNGTIFVAGGGSSTGTGLSYTLASSTDGFTWVPRDSGQIFGYDPYSTTAPGIVYALAWNGLIWVAVGSSGGTSTAGGNVVATSPDGITWTGRGSFLIQAQSGNTQAKVAAAAFLLPNNTVAPQSTNVTLIGQTGNTYNFYYSTVDGLNLVRYQFAPGINAFWNAAWNGTLWMAVTGVTNANVYTSADGLNWTTRAVANATGLYGVAWSPNLSIWVVCGSTATSAANIQYSYDTITWTNAGVGTTTVFDVQWVSSPAFLGGAPQNVFVAVGASTFIYYTTTVGTFVNTSITTTALGTIQLNSVVFCPTLGLWIVGGVGNGTASVGYVPAVTSGSTPYAGTWVVAGNALATMTNVQQLAWSQSLGVLVAAGNGVNSIMSTTNGTTWTGIGGASAATSLSTFSTGSTGVAFNPVTNLFIATGTGINTFISSPDGFNWTPFGTTGVDLVGYGIAWSPLLTQWIMVGQGNHSIATSSNAINWVGRTGTQIFSSQGNGVVWCPGLNAYVAVGQGTNVIATSTNGINWVSRLTATSNPISALTGGGYCVAFNGTIVVAGGNGGSLIATSPDTVNWTARTSGSITTTVFSVAYSPLLTQWVIGGNNGVIAVSYGATITGSAPSTFSSTGTTSGLGASGGNVRALAWNPVNNLYVLGANTTTSGSSPLSTSNDGLFFANLQPLINILYSVYCVAYNGSLWVAGGSGASNTLAASIDGINWTGQGASVFTGTGGACYGIAWNGWTNVGGAQPWIPIAAPGTTANSFTWIAVGATSGGSGVMAYSTVGTTPYASTITMSWASISQAVITTAVYGIVWYPYTSVWVAVGTGTNTIGYTIVPSGQSGWTAASGTQISGSITNNPPLPNGAITSAATGRAVAFGYVNGAGLLVAVGAGGTNCYAYSVNGVTWTGNGAGNFLGTGSAGVPLTSPAVQLMQCGNGIAWSPSTYTFVVTGFGTSALAQSATNYTTQNTIISSARPDLTTNWVAANSATVLSTVTISSATTVYGSVFGGFGSATGQGNAVIWNGSMFVAVGQGPMSTGLVKANVGLPPPSSVLSSFSSFSTVAPNAALSGTIVPYVVEATSLDGVNWRPAPLAPSQQQYMTVAARYPIMVCGGAGTGTGTTNYLGYSLDNAISWVPLNKTTTYGSQTGANAGATAAIYCVAYNGIIWMAGGAATTAQLTGNSYMISKDGITWTAPTVPTAGTYPVGLYPGYNVAAGAIYGIAWANSLGLWCVVGQSGAATNPTIATSPDGVNWTARGGVGAAGLFYTAATTSTASAVAWNGTYFVVIGSNPTAAASISVVYSRDGVSWAVAAQHALVPVTQAGTPNAASIAWNGNVWVLVTTGPANNNANVIYWSSTTFSWNSIVAATALGASYTFPSNNTFTFLGVARSVAWNGSLFLVTGGFSGSAAGTPTGAPVTYGYYIATSPDGFNWTSRNMTLVGSGSFTTGASVGGGWLTTQTGSSSAAYGVTLQMNTVAWHPISRQWVIGVTDSTNVSGTTPYAGIATLVSTDSINWTIAMNNGFNNAAPIKSLVWGTNQNYWVMVGSAVPSATSTGYAQATGTAAVQGYLTIATSTDGFQIVPRLFYNSTNNPLGSFNAVAYFNGNYLAGGAVGSTLISSTGYYGIYASTDGINWTGYLLTQGGSNAVPTVIYGIAYSTGDNKWYVAGTAGATNGYLGSGAINSNIVGLSQSNNFNGARPIYSVAFGNGFVVAVGAAGGTSGGALQYQISNTTFTNASTLGFTTAAYAVVYAPFTRATPIWIAGGAGTIAIATSPSSGPGTWTTQSSATSLFTAVYGLAANTNIAVAVGTGTNTIAYSYDGATWVGVANTTSSAIFSNGYCVAWNGSLFVAGGDYNTQATSPDGINWTPRRILTGAVNTGSLGCFALGFQTREKTLTVNNAQWTGRTSQQNFRVIG